MDTITTTETATITVGETAIHVDNRLIACGDLDCFAISPTSNITELVTEIENLRIRRRQAMKNGTDNLRVLHRLTALRNSALTDLRHLINHYKNNTDEYGCTHR